MDIGVLGRVPPQAVEAEQAVLGSLMLDKDIHDDVFEIITADDFYREDSRQIFECMIELRLDKQPVDIISVADKLRGRGSLDAVGGFDYLSKIANDVPTTANAKYYCKIIQEKAAYRRLIKLSQSVANNSYECSKEVQDIINKTLENIDEIKLNEIHENGFVPDLLSEVVQDIETQSKSGTIVGIPTGFTQLDKKIYGWQKHRYYVLGARPKMGKTSFFCQLADIASDTFPVVIFSLEMKKKDLVKLLIYQNARVDSSSEQKGKLNEEDWACIGNAISDLYQRNMYIDDESMTIPQIRASLKRIQKEFTKRGRGNIGMIVIDYVQLIEGDRRLQRNYQLEDISRGLNNLKKDFECTVLALSQLSREVEKRKDCRPLPSDLRDTGSFEQDCDGLMLMYRDVYYNGRTAENTKEYTFGTKKVVADVVEINFYLNRHGPTGLIKLDFVAPSRLFINRRTKGEVDENNNNSGNVQQTELPFKV